MVVFIMTDTPLIPPPSERDLNRILATFNFNPSSYEEHIGFAERIYWNGFGKAYAYFPRATSQDGWREVHREVHKMLRP